MIFLQRLPQSHLSFSPARTVVTSSVQILNQPLNWQLFSLGLCGEFLASCSRIFCLFCWCSIKLCCGTHSEQMHIQSRTDKNNHLWSKYITNVREMSEQMHLPFFLQKESLRCISSGSSVPYWAYFSYLYPVDIHVYIVSPTLPALLFMVLNPALWITCLNMYLRLNFCLGFVF